LLDLFTVNECDAPMAAGRVDLNTRNAPVLAALLGSTTADVVLSGTMSSPVAIANNIIQLTSTSQLATTGSGGPLLGKDEIVTKLVPSLSGTDFSTTDEQSIKARREAATRALVDAGQARTWNLLIDIVAQSGRYPPSATSLNQFIVEGERHCWLHVAIDRYTGQVIDQQLETVSE